MYNIHYIYAKLGRTEIATLYLNHVSKDLETPTSSSRETPGSLLQPLRECSELEAEKT